MTAVYMRSETKKLSISERRAARRAEKEELSSQIEYGDRITILERINTAAADAKPPGKKIGYQAVCFALNPDHAMYSERVLSEARKLISERIKPTS